MVYFLQPNRGREPFLNAPPAVLGLIAVLVLAHIARVLAPGDWPDRALLDFGFIPARFSQSADALIAAGLSPLSWPGTMFTLVSYMFVHGSFLHLTINSVWLLAFGTPVARRFGTFKFLLFSLICGIAAALAHLAIYWDSAAPVVGASGAVSGLMAAGIRIMYGWANAMHDGPPGLAPLHARPVLVFTALWVVTNIVAGVTGIGTSGDVTLVAWEAHLGGYFAGLFAAGLFVRGSSLPRPA